MSAPDPHLVTSPATSLPAPPAGDPPTDVAPPTRPELRVDGPHGLGQPPAEAIEPAAEPQQLLVQLKQLAAQLRTRQDELDRREALLNAREAKIDQGGRTARLWVAEQESELDGRRGELERQQREVDQRLEQLAPSEQALDRRRQDAVELEEIVAQCEAAVNLRDKLLAEQIAAHRAALKQFEVQQQQAADALEFEKQQIDTRREASLVVVRQLLAGIEQQRAALDEEEERARLRARRFRSAELDRQGDLGTVEAALERRFEKLEQGEQELAAAQAEYQRLREELQAERQAGEEAVRNQRRELAQQQRRNLAEIEAKRQAVQRRSEHLDQVQASLEQLRGELGRIHRETLEIRVATEELWIELSASLPPAKLTRSLSQVRARLMDDYRAAGDQLRGQREELDGIRNELAGEHDRLVRQKGQLERWAQTQQQELQALADRLVARGRQLDRQDAQMAQQIHVFEIERLEYQQEIRRLRNLVPEDQEELATA